MKAIDVMGFAGSMSAGVDQAGFDVLAKREPAAFDGFGVDSHVYNMPWLEAQVSAPEDWDLPAERDIDLVYGCPPCSGFSQLSAVNTKVYEHTGTTYRGADADINECMVWMIDYAARIKPRALILESVGPAFKLGRDWMEGLWQRLRLKTGIDYYLNHVNMDAQWVGGDVKRPRYFLVATTEPFGIGLEFVQPRNLIDVISDLQPEDWDDEDWAHHPVNSRSYDRIRKTIEWLNEMGRNWEPGTRLPQNTEGLDPPDWWRKDKPSPSKRGYDPNIYSHWYSTDPFSPVRWRPDKPFGVIVAASLDRAIHPYAPRPLTFREAARFMSIPDTWSMRVIAEKHKPAELGKAVPSASAKWIAYWVRKALEGTPGEFAGAQDTGDPMVSVFNVQKKADLKRIADGKFEEYESWWDSITDPDPANWLIDRKARPSTWWQREDEAGIFS